MMYILWFENVGYGMIHVQLAGSCYNPNLTKNTSINLCINFAGSKSIIYSCNWDKETLLLLKETS